MLACRVFFLPESPRWLIDTDQIEEAFHAFKAIHVEAPYLHDEESDPAEFQLAPLFNCPQEAVRA
jgi:hypothetical protein